MKEPSKFKRWFLGLFGGVPKSDYDIVVEHIIRQSNGLQG